MRWAGTDPRLDYRPGPGKAAISPARRTTRLLALALLACCGSCASLSEVPAESAPLLFEIAGIEIRNDLEYGVTDVQVLVPETGDFVSCGTIFNRSSCAAAFPQREYRGSALRVTWKEHGQPRSIDDFVLTAPAALDPGQPVWIQVVIFAPGQAGARLLREPGMTR